MTTELTKFPKVRRFGTLEVDGIFDGPVEITEKLDGANARVWYNGKDLVMGSRNHSMISEGQAFNNGLGTWVANHTPALVDLFEDIYAEFGVGIMLVGELMDKNRVPYNLPDKPVIFYDAMFVGGGEDASEFVSDEARAAIMDIVSTHKFLVNFPIFTGKITSSEFLNEYSALPSTLNPDVQMEGVVVKRSSYINKFGRQCHAKLVNESFSEVTKTKVKQVKTSIDYSVIVEQFVTPSRVIKLIEKNNLPTDLVAMKELSVLVPSDILSEEILTIRDMVNVLDFKMFNAQCSKRTVKVINELLLQV